MSINISETLSHGLSLLTYNGKSITTPRDNQLNIFMGIGLWSVKDRLSEGLPIDVMHMLLSATVMRSQIMEANQGKSSKVILLIADSMAVREGADQQMVSHLVRIYKKSLEPLLELLNIKKCSEIILSSELETSRLYAEALQSVENSEIVKRLAIKDKIHHAYIRTQTAINHYMDKYEHVGIKVGWICVGSSKKLHGRASAQALKQWDELKFDRWCQEICKESTIQYLYTKAGLKQPENNNNVIVSEGCPYTAYSKDRRYVVQTQGKKDIRNICEIQDQVKTHWEGVAEVCLSLMQVRLVNCTLLPENCMIKGDAKTTVYNMLNHWANPPDLSRMAFGDLVSLLLSNSTYNPTLQDSYMLRMLEMTLIEAVDKPKTSEKCKLL